MAKRTTTPMATPERIVEVDVGEEMRGSFLEYAYSVIYARALPDARDGLKPVQRRILYQAGEMGLRPDRGHVKSARVVGEVMGRLHPHGEGAIYDALVRMAQAFSLRLPFIDGHGNFGSLDDGPAAMRYTECRLAPAAMPMIAGIHEDTVDFVPNYDGREQEPVVLPAAIPSLLVNGATGIAVGMATNIAPHNLGEVINAARHLLDHPTADTADLMRFVPGPDLPSGGRIVGLEGIRDAYTTGRGSFRMRATATIEQVTPRRRGIVITELPYNVGVERVMQRIKDLHSAKKIVGISGMTDLTDGDQGLRLLIEVKSGINPEALLEQLYKQTPLEEQFNINAVALVDGAPATLGLKQMLEVFLAHRREVVRRRSEFRRGKAADRLHLVEGLLIAILDIDEVIAVIRSSEDAAEARSRLIAVFDLTDTQAGYILEMPLRRLTKYSRIELEDERDELHATIAELTGVLESPQLLSAAVADELAQVGAEHATPRRTVLMAEPARGSADEGQMSLEMADEPCLVVLSGTGLIARLPLPEGTPVGEPGAHSSILTTLRTSTRADFGIVTDRGRLVRMPVVDLPALPATANHPSLVGAPAAADFAHLTEDERAVGVVPLDDRGFALGTRAGIVKRVAPDAPANKDEWSIISLKEDDRVVAAATCDDDDELVFISSAAALLRFPADLVRPQGRTAAGVAGMKLPPEAQVVAFAVADPDSALVLTVAGGAGGITTAKITPLVAFPGKGRATGGVRCQRLLSGETELRLAAVGPAPAASEATGGNVALPTPEPKRDASGQPVPTLLAAVGGGLPPLGS
ncbi:MAG: DNA topoisomerase IV subunit A [Actinobacteria bacterium]|nr:DNA topoisomerase IV subunit A [Actinomycetota bacterium]MCB9412744.1 DNA topoisomerase IV subunit A [Actinomycetota bacterium]